jgi:hypothetical protein
VADTSRALERFRFFLAWRAAPDGGFEPVGEMVGKSPDGSPFGDVSAPLGSAGDPDPRVLLGRLGSVDADADGDGVAAAITPTVAAEWKARALLARAVAVSVICSPEDAPLRTNEAATSTSLWPVGRAPTVQTSPLGFGHTVNRAASTCATLPMTAVTLTP